MRKVALLIPALLLVLAPLGFATAAETVPEGKEDLVLDSMSKAREAAGKKVIKGPVPFAHESHVDNGVTCEDCHHKLVEGEAPRPCSTCHTEKKGKVPRLSDAFHGEEGGGLPSLNSCIGCHKRKVATMRSTDAPTERKPCDACHSILKK